MPELTTAAPAAKEKEVHAASAANQAAPQITWRVILGKNPYFYEVDSKNKGGIMGYLLEDVKLGNQGGREADGCADAAMRIRGTLGGILKAQCSRGGRHRKA